MKTTLIAIALSLTACSTMTVNVISAPAPKAPAASATSVETSQVSTVMAALDDSSGMVWCTSDGRVCGRRR